MKKPVAMKITLTAALAVFLVLAGALVKVSIRIMEYRKAAAEYETLSAYGPENTVTADESPDDATWSDAKIDFNALRANNPQIAAWIFIPDTRINYPVVAGEDNAYYLTHTFLNTENRSGAIFIDCRCASDFSGRNTLIHGHHMKDGSMFRDLINYRDDAFARAHPAVWLYTPDKTYCLRVFSVATVPVTVPFWQLEFADDNEFLDFLRQAEARSTTDFGMTPNTSDRVVTLITCDNETEDVRFVLQAVLDEVSG